MPTISGVIWSSASLTAEGAQALVSLRPNGMGRFAWFATGDGWSVAGSASSAQDAIAQAEAEVGERAVEVS